MKPGYKTTEFWLTTLTALVPIANNAFGLHIDPATIAQVAGGVVAAYTLSRGFAKKGSADAK